MMLKKLSPILPDRPPLNRLKGRVALVTGTARPRGLGNAVAQLFAKEGATVILTDIANELRDRTKELQDAGYKAVGYQLDLNKLDDVREMVKKVVDQFGKIDLLCNVAGKSVPPRPPFLDMSVEYWDMVMDRNLRTTFNCCKAVLPVMVEKKYGKVVNIGSTTGTMTAYRYCAAYAASKGAVSGLTKALALEFGEYNINVNAILPGDIDTGEKPWTPQEGPRDLGQFRSSLKPPISRPAMPEEIADLALYLSTDESRYITGTDILCDGGALIVEPFPGGPQG
jgi:NAD(P)-dependent dehydrogenase (short-subunit alcohol dehydrogenase family)